MNVRAHIPMKGTILITILILFQNFSVLGQDSDSTKNQSLYYVYTNDKDEFIGYIQYEDDNSLHLQTKSYGLLLFKKDQIQSILKVDEQFVKNGKVWKEFPQAMRYFIQGNSYTLKKGQGYYNNIWVLFNNFGYGITDHFTIGGGFFAGFFFSDATPFYLTAKYGTNSNKTINAAVNVLVGNSLTSHGREISLLINPTITIGRRDKNFNVGTILGLTNDVTGGSPIITLSGAYRITPSTFIIAESYISTNNYNSFDNRKFGENSLIFVGGRSGSPKISFDYGLMAFLDHNYYSFIIPIIGITVPFGK